MWEKVCDFRKGRLRFYSVRPGPRPEALSLSEVYKPTGSFSKAFKGTRADKWDTQAGSDRHDQMRAFVFCADCFDYGKQASPNPQVEWTEEMTSLFKWLATHKDNRTMVMIFDGRSRECRHKIDEWNGGELPRREQAG